MDSYINRLVWHFENVSDTITPMDAIKRYGMTRLADVVFRAKKAGYHIETIMTEGENRYGQKIRFATYKYCGKREE